MPPTAEVPLMPRTPNQIGLQEVADRLGVHYMTAYRYVRTGRLPAVRVEGEWKIDPRDLRTLSQQPARRKSGAGWSRTTVSARLEERLLASDEAGAWRIVEDALTSGAEPSDILVDVIAPAMKRIGDRWESGALTVADEHAATTVALRVVGRLGPRFARRGRKRGTVVIGAPAGEQHSLPVALASDVLRGAGYEVADLGANTPAESFAQVVAHTSGVVAVVVTSTVAQPGVVASIVPAVRETGVPVPVVVGGASADEQRVPLGADRVARGDARALVRLIDELVRAT